jgi:hypothetical protein
MTTTDLCEAFKHLGVKDDVTKVCEHIAQVNDERIKILKSKEVVQWLFGDLSFLATEDKASEDKWGQSVLKTRRPDLTMNGQWTTRFGEHLCEELAVLCSKNPTKPAKKEHYQPDIEVEDAIWEVKTQTYHTSGTAGEKILGCPFKYADIPELYDKPVYIICVGGAERVCRENYGNLPGKKCTPKKQKIIDFFKSCNVEYKAATEILRGLLPPHS